jgi:hypothetical protein
MILSVYCSLILQCVRTLLCSWTSTSSAINLALKVTAVCPAAGLEALHEHSLSRSHLLKNAYGHLPTSRIL